MERLHGDVPASLKKKVRVYCLENKITVGQLMVELLATRGLKP